MSIHDSNEKSNTNHIVARRLLKYLAGAFLISGLLVAATGLLSSYCKI